MNNYCIRVVDGGGNGFRRADVFGLEIKNSKEIGPVKKINDLLDFVGTDLLPETQGFAYAVAGVIENHNIVVKSPNIPMLNGLALGDLTAERTGRPTAVCNDMEAAVLGMAKFFPQLPYFMGITWSSGLGLRIFKDGEILIDSEGGHIPFDLSPYAPLCGCGVRGCAESILGGDAIRRRVIAEIQTLDIDFLEDFDPCYYLDECFLKKEKWALDIYDLISSGMASFLSTIQSIFHLPAVVWKGTFARKALPKIEKDIRLKMRGKLINPDWEKDMEFFFSPEKPENADAFVGAAAICAERLRN